MLFAAEPDLATAARIETVLPFTIAAHRQTRAEGIGGADEQAVRCRGKRASAPVELVAEAVTRDRPPVDPVVGAPPRSEQRRVGEGGGSTCGSRWCPVP